MRIKCLKASRTGHFDCDFPPLSHEGRIVSAGVPLAGIMNGEMNKNLLIVGAGYYGQIAYEIAEAMGGI
ncbi:MAG: hypothetical protein ACI4TA_01860 [Acetatifactor sp.]